MFGLEQYNSNAQFVSRKKNKKVMPGKVDEQWGLI